MSWAHHCKKKGGTGVELISPNWLKLNAMYCQSVCIYKNDIFKASPICKRVTRLSLSRPTLACKQVVKGAMGLLLKAFTATSRFCQTRRKFSAFTRRQPVFRSHNCWPIFTLVWLRLDKTNLYKVFHQDAESIYLFFLLLDQLDQAWQSHLREPPPQVMKRWLSYRFELDFVEGLSCRGSCRKCVSCRGGFGFSCIRLITKTYSLS